MGKGEFLFLLQGLKWTVVLAIVSFLCGTITGLAIALLRTSGYAAVAVSYTHLTLPTIYSV